MPKICANGPDCKFLKAPKGCKFLHPAMDKETLAPKMYAEIISALNQAHCTAKCHEKNIGGRITRMMIDHYSYEELAALMANPDEFAESIYMSLDVIEDYDRAMYVPVIE